MMFKRAEVEGRILACFGSCVCGFSS